MAKAVSGSNRVAHKFVHPFGSVGGVSFADSEKSRASDTGRREMILNRLPGHLCNGDSPTSRLESKPAIDLLGKHDRRPLHDASITHHPSVR